MFEAIMRGLVLISVFIVTIAGQTSDADSTQNTCNLKDQPAVFKHCTRQCSYTKSEMELSDCRKQCILSFGNGTTCSCHRNCLSLMLPLKYLCHTICEVEVNSSNALQNCQSQCFLHTNATNLTQCLGICNGGHDTNLIKNTKQGILETIKHISDDIEIFNSIQKNRTSCPAPNCTQEVIIRYIERCTEKYPKNWGTTVKPTISTNLLITIDCNFPKNELEIYYCIKKKTNINVKSRNFLKQVLEIIVKMERGKSNKKVIQIDCRSPKTRLQIEYCFKIKQGNKLEKKKPPSHIMTVIPKKNCTKTTPKGKDDQKPHLKVNCKLPKFKWEINYCHMLNSKNKTTDKGSLSFLKKILKSIETIHGKNKKEGEIKSKQSIFNTDNAGMAFGDSLNRDYPGIIEGPYGSIDNYIAEIMNEFPDSEIILLPISSLVPYESLNIDGLNQNNQQIFNRAFVSELATNENEIIKQLRQHLRKILINLEYGYKSDNDKILAQDTQNHIKNFLKVSQRLDDIYMNNPFQNQIKSILELLQTTPNYDKTSELEGIPPNIRQPLVNKYPSNSYILRRICPRYCRHQ